MSEAQGRLPTHRSQHSLQPETETETVSLTAVQQILYDDDESKGEDVGRGYGHTHGGKTSMCTAG